MNKRVSIVCVSHQRPQLLIRAIESCISQDYHDLEVIVLLNPADDATEQKINHHFPSVRVIRTHRNLGINPAKNLAIANADGDFVFTLDDDAYFLGEDVISQLVRAFESEPALGCVVCNIEGDRETTYEGKDRYLSCYKDGFAMVPRAAYTEWVGFYPDLFFRSASETFLATALWDQGRPVKCLVNSRMYHELSMAGRSMRDWNFYGLRSQALCVVLRDPWLLVLPSLLSKFIKSFLDIARTKQPGTWLAAWWSFLIHIPEVLSQRRPISWGTYRLLRRLQREVITSLSQLQMKSHR